MSELCRGCGIEAKDTSLGAWCDSCGGVAIRPGKDGAKPELLFRHVCTLDGKGGRFPVVYDQSTADYAMPYDREIKEYIKENDEWRQRTKTFMNHGTLDIVIALGQPLAKGNCEEVPEISVAPSATDEERGMVLD